MRYPFLRLEYKTHGKFLWDAMRTNRDIVIKPGTRLYEQLWHYIETHAKYWARVEGKSAVQRMHESAIAYYQNMLEGSVSEDDRRYAENHIASHRRSLEEATREFKRELEAEKNALPT